MLDTKRSIDEESPDLSSHDDKKQNTKPGRKPIETEPKSKRTAQNRAAQRAYRERKERKMKDLEDKVNSLEDDKLQAEAQIELLKSELSRYRGHSDFSDLKPISHGKLKRESSESGLSSTDFTVGFPWAKSASADSEIRSNTSSNHLPDLTSGSSSSNSPLNENVIVSPQSNASDAYSVPSTSSTNMRHTTSSLFEEELNPFCASLNEACGTRQKPIPKYHRDSQSYPRQELKAAPLPLSNADSAFQSLFTPNLDLPDPLFNSTGESSFNFSLDNSYARGNSMSLFNDANFDINLALGNLSNDPIEKNAQSYPDVDSLPGLVSEESAYDPLNQVNTDFNFNEFVKSSYSGSESSRNNSLVDGHKPASSVTSFNSPAIPEEDEKDEIVPAPADTMKCSEIWDRITAHPKYTEIDIDGLCSELKAKAKCSEQGVVLDAEDVSTLIERSARNRI